MEETMLTLKQDVTLIEKNGKIGLALNGRTKFANSARQEGLLNALVMKKQSLEGLKELMQTRDSRFESENEISIAIAELILDFGEFLEA